MDYMKCPICGEHPGLDGYEVGGGLQVFCCEPIWPVFAKTEREAIEGWNTRVKEYTNESL